MFYTAFYTVRFTLRFTLFYTVFYTVLYTVCFTGDVTVIKWWHTLDDQQIAVIGSKVRMYYVTSCLYILKPSYHTSTKVSVLDFVPFHVYVL